jgi:hypothetical protein
MVVMPDLSAAHPGEELFGAIGAGPGQAVGFLVVMA